VADRRRLKWLIFWRPLGDAGRSATSQKEEPMFAKHLILACASLVFLSARADAGLIVNGSFETPPVPAGTFTNFLSGSTAITGWTVVGIDSALVNGTFTQNGIVFQAQNGNQYIDLAGITSNSTTSGVTQNVATTAGMTYLLSFYVGSATDNVFHFASTVDLSINGSPRTSFTNNTAPTITSIGSNLPHPSLPRVQRPTLLSKTEAPPTTFSAHLITYR
jgi:hypothetical protein